MQELQKANQFLILNKPPSQYLTECRAETISDCLYSEAGNINKLSKEGVNVKALIVYLLSDLVEVFNFGKTMKEGNVNGSHYTQISDCANALISDYWYYSPEDFKRLCNNIKSLKYGLMYESIDESKIRLFAAMYETNRQEEIISLREKENGENKQLLKEPLIAKLIENAPDEISKNLNAIADKLLKKEIKEFAPREKTEAELLMDGYINDFDTLFKQQDTGKIGQRFVKYKGEMRNIDGYCNTRFSEDKLKE